MQCRALWDGTDAVRHRDIELSYACQRTVLGPALAPHFVELSLDADTRAWLDAALDRPHGRVRELLRRGLGHVVSPFDANGLLGTCPMRVLGTDQARQLLGGRVGGRLLDIGAGNGDVTAELAPLFDEVVTTELAAPMARRLSRRGLRSHAVDLSCDALPEPGPFDAVALLNVLDRTRYPSTLLDRALGLLAPGGLLIVAVPLPLSPTAFVGAASVDPEEPLPEARGEGFEAAVNALWDGLFAPRALRLECLTRVPYLSGGGRSRPVYVLDDALFVCRAP